MPMLNERFLSKIGFIEIGQGLQSRFVQKPACSVEYQELAEKMDFSGREQ